MRHSYYLIFVFLFSCTQTNSIDVSSLVGSWTSTDTSTTQAKLIFYKDKLQVIRDNKAGLLAQIDNVFGSNDKNNPLNNYSYKIENDTINCKYLSKLTESAFQHMTILKIYKNSEDTLVMHELNSDNEIKFTKDKK